MEILVTSVMKTADANKFFLAFFERTFYDAYMYDFL